MSALSKYSGARTPTLIVNKCSSGTRLQPYGVYNAKDTYINITVANTLTQALSLVGGGELNLLAYCGADATARILRLKLTLDGVVVFDVTSGNQSSAAGLFAVGCPAGISSAAFQLQKITFNTSCLVEVASSVVENGVTYLISQYAN